MKWAMNFALRRPRLIVALRLGRVSNLPTVWTNVLAGMVLVGVNPSYGRAAVVCLALSMMYVAGMYLNDAFDREYDRIQRPERPIPAGHVTALWVFQVGFGLLIAGVLTMIVVALVTGTGWRAVRWMLVLAALIVFYDVRHKQSAASPLVMGLCRASVYICAAFAVRSYFTEELYIGAALLVSYLIGLTYIAKQENLRHVKNLWPLVFLAAPFIVAFPEDPAGYACYGLLALVVGEALLALRARLIKDAVTGLIAGISVLDALLIAREGRPMIAIACILLWSLTRYLQGKVPGT